MLVALSHACAAFLAYALAATCVPDQPRKYLRLLLVALLPWLPWLHH